MIIAKTKAQKRYDAIYSFLLYSLWPGLLLSQQRAYFGKSSSTNQSQHYTVLTNEDKYLNTKN